MRLLLPDIFLFNPTCEYAVANGHVSWQPNRLLQKMEEDLEFLPALFAKPDDVILVKKTPAEPFLCSLKDKGIIPPTVVLQEDIKTNPAFVKQPKNRLMPWGWSPAAHHLLAPLKNSCSAEFLQSPVAHWTPASQEIYSRKFALQILNSVLHLLPPEITMSPKLIPQVVTSKAEIEEAISRWGKIMIKAPWSSSGRGLQKITKTPVTDKVWEKLLGFIRQQGFAMAEPFLNKLLDMAFQFELKRGNVTFLGISRFFTDSKGQYQGNYLHGWPDFIETDTRKFAERLPEILVDPLIVTLEKSKLANLYEGIFGVDLLIFMDEKGKLKVNPCLEMNIRQNMGLLSVQLEKKIETASKGIFRIMNHSNLLLPEYLKEQERKHPLKLRNSKILSGFFPLTPVFKETKFGAFVLVST
ncbi:MAG: hypothetical protein PHU98_09015 [Mariniphaga sp.]|nr:hypothetical protein [Mariniphaga sp.]